MIMKELDQIAQCAAERWSRNCRIAPEAEVARLELIAEPKTKVVALGDRRSNFEELTVRFQFKL